uniref:Uncharacterized protein n=1 Tax=Cannabis sativa TaxID=3483 RepID=A0A803NMU6_CANSA
MILTRKNVSTETQDSMAVNLNVYVPLTSDNSANPAQPPRANPSAGFQQVSPVNVRQDLTNVRQVPINAGQPAQSTTGVPLTRATPRYTLEKLDLDLANLVSTNPMLTWGMILSWPD